MRYAVVLSISVLLGFGCGNADCKDPNRNSYDLEAPMTITPAKQAYTLADTITLAIDVPTTLKNRINGREETILEFDVGYELLIERIDSSFGDKIFTDDTYDNINMVSRSNEGTDKFAPRSIYFAPQLKKDTIYSASFSFVFTQPGVYSMKVNDYTDEDFFYMGENIRDNIIIENQCDKTCAIYYTLQPSQQRSRQQPQRLV